MHQNEEPQAYSQSISPDSPPELMDFRIRDDFEEAAPPLPPFCLDGCDNG